MSIKTILAKKVASAPSIADVLLHKHGIEMVPLGTVLIGNLDNNRCYYNAYAHCLANPTLRYCEGYARLDSTGIPVLHAWAVDRDLRVIETTWNTTGEYFGVVFSLLFVHKMVSRINRYGVFGNIDRLRMDAHNATSFIEQGLQLFSSSDA